MTDHPARSALADTLAYLGGLARDHVQPQEALARLAALRTTHPGLRVDLVWDTSRYAENLHYDALLRAPGADTVSLSVCPVGDTPWPLRGARLASDHDLLRVNGETLKVRDAMACLDFLWNEARILQALVDLCLVEEAVKELDIEPTAEHTQRALDAFRAARGLLAASDMHAWMHDNAVTHEGLTHMMHARAQEYALRERVAGERVDAWHAAHRGALDVAHLVRLRVRSRTRAEAIVAQLATRDFHAVMEEAFAARQLVALPYGPLQSIRRRDMRAPDAAAVFAAAGGDVVGPIESDAGFDFLRVIRIEPADLLRDDTRHGAIDAIFDEWLGERRRAASVEWFWGPAR